MTDALLYIAVLAGVAAAGFLVARQPAFWIGLAKEILWALLPFVLKRKTPNEEKADNEAYGRGEQLRDGKAHGHGGENR